MKSEVYKGYEIVFLEELNLYRIIAQEKPIKLVYYFDTIEEAKEEINKIIVD